MNNLRGIKQIGRIENTRRRSIHAKNNIKDRGQSPRPNRVISNYI